MDRYRLLRTYVELFSCKLQAAQIWEEEYYCGMGENRSFKFQKLTPFEKAEMTGYEENLDYVFEKDNGDIKNVAISGPFGSGKSSVIRTYDKEHPDKKFIYISLAHFEGIPDEDDEYESVLEKKIINHLIQQVPECDVPDSGLRVKRTFDTKKGKSLAIRFVILIAFILYCSMWPDIHEMEDKVRLCDVLTGVIGTAIIGGVGLLNIFWLIIKALHAINNRRGIKSIQFKDVSMEFDDDQDKSYFDKHLDEILYLLQNAKCDAIIFEDIDRFDKADLKLLEHLRELCILGNSRIAVADGHTCRTLRFIYLIGDDVFKSNSDRTKFFDLIIPVIPVVDASNSYAKMREIFEKVGIFEQFDDHFLRGLCLYLDDFRTVKNIIEILSIWEILPKEEQTNTIINPFIRVGLTVLMLIFVIWGWIFFTKMVKQIFYMQIPGKLRKKFEYE